jgi:deoxynucleoside triphosphate triphosphohydrolase SAMHD1
VLFVEEIIRGTSEDKRRGRLSSKYFLYDIVNNSRSGLDVDKLDYFQRDIRHTNVFTGHDQFDRFIEFGRVLPAMPIEATHSKGKLSQDLIGNDQDKDLAFFDSPMSVRNDEHAAAPDLSFMICYPEKMVGEALQLFSLRYQLHQKVYTHKSVKKIEYMVSGCAVWCSA